MEKTIWEQYYGKKPEDLLSSGEQSAKTADKLMFVKTLMDYETRVSDINSHLVTEYKKLGTGTLNVNMLVGYGVELKNIEVNLEILKKIYLQVFGEEITKVTEALS